MNPRQTNAAMRLAERAIAIWRDGNAVQKHEIIAFVADLAREDLPRRSMAHLEMRLEIIRSSSWRNA